MPVPFPLASDGYHKSVSMAREAIEARLKNATNRLSTTPVVHRGMANEDALPNEDLAIWVDWTEHVEDMADATQRASFYRMEWLITIVARNDDNDTHGTHSDLGEELWGSVISSFTEFQEDLGLDGSVEFTRDPGSTKTIGKDTAGDRRYVLIDIVLHTQFSAEHIRVV